MERLWVGQGKELEQERKRSVGTNLADHHNSQLGHAALFPSTPPS